MPATLELKVGGHTYSDQQIPQAFLDLGMDGIRAFAYSIGNEQVQEQIKKGNELAGVYVDGYASRRVDQMKRDIVWEFSLSNSQLVKAVREALEMLRKFSNSFAGKGSGKMASSWEVYVNGKPSTPDALQNVDLSKDDIKITSPLAYARFLDSGHWTGDARVLKREAKRGVKALNKGKIFRMHIAVTEEVASRLSRAYKTIYISDKWFEQSDFTSSFKTSKDSRWPAITFSKRKKFR